MRPDKAHTENSTYFICNVYRKFYSSRFVAIYMCIVFIWKPKLLLCLVGLPFWGKKILIETEIRGFHK